MMGQIRNIFCLNNTHSYIMETLNKTYKVIKQIPVTHTPFKYFYGQKFFLMPLNKI